MSLTALIEAKTAAETSAALTLTGPTTIVADDLAMADGGDSEKVEIHRERVDGDFELLILHGVPAVLDVSNPVLTIEFYGDIKAVKGVTSNTVAVGYGS